MASVGNYSEIGINFSVFSNTNISFNEFTNQTTGAFFNNITQSANDTTGGFLAIILLFTIGLFLVYTLTDKRPIGNFGYSSIRGLGISLGIISTLGIVMLSIGIATNFIHISILMTLYIIMLIYVIVANPS